MSAATPNSSQIMMKLSGWPVLTRLHPFSSREPSGTLGRVDRARTDLRPMVLRVTIHAAT